MSSSSVSGGDVHVDDPLGVEHDLADRRCRFVDEPEDLFAKNSGASKR